MTKTKNNIIIAIALFVAAASAVYFLISPLYRELESIQVANKNKEQELRSLVEKREYLELLSKDSAKLDNANQITTSLLPEDDNTSKFIVLLEELASKEGLIMSNLSIAENKKTKVKNINANAIEFSFQTEADFQKAISLLNSLENFTRLNIISSLSLNEMAANNLAIKITGYIFYE